MGKKIFFLFFFFYSTFIQAKEFLPEWKKKFNDLSSEEKLYLESFFRTMLTDSEAGFVLAGSKPMCMEGILNSKKLSAKLIGSKIHNRSIKLSEGYRVWEKYFKPISTKKLMICCKNHPDRVYANWIHLIWVHPQRLIEVVRKNLTLFQYVLGPQITPESFLNFLTDPSEDIPHDHTLNGIFLGFGTQNALYYHRLELMQRQMYTRATPPFLNKLISSDLGYLGSENIASFKTNPSFSYSTLREEFQYLEKMGRSSQQVLSSKIPLFSVYKQDEETNDLLFHYQNDLKIIESLLTKPDFLEYTLEYIFE